ncbi:MAG: pyruvate kinase alpha/beta domain-containing protein [Candidatus Methanofastidiosia archaeon]
MAFANVEKSENVTKNITYFLKPGKDNSEKCLDVAVERAKELGIKNFVVATTTGETGLALAKIISPSQNNIVAVTHMVGFKGIGADEMDKRAREELNAKGIKVLTTTHALSGVGRGIRNKIGLPSPQELMGQTLKLFGQGMKVCLEISIMAADAGLIPMDEKIVAIGGTGRGADTACIIRPAHSNNVFDFKFSEIICMPR